MKRLRKGNWGGGGVPTSNGLFDGIIEPLLDVKELPIVTTIDLVVEEV